METNLIQTKMTSKFLSFQKINFLEDGGLKKFDRSFLTLLIGRIITEDQGRTRGTEEYKHWFVQEGAVVSTTVWFVLFFLSY